MREVSSIKEKETAATVMLQSTSEADTAIQDANEELDPSTGKWYSNIKYAVVGMLFGIVFVKAEVLSWFRIQEMFRLQSFHMYGVIGTAVVVAVISVWLIKKLKIKTIDGDPIVFHPKKFNKGQIYGGLLFGFGWAMTGACPGPLFAQIGMGATVVIVTLLSAIAGTWVYGYFSNKLPR